MKKMILELGGFYLKVGQVFATKSDLLPPQYVAALKSVFDDCPPVSAKKIDDREERSRRSPVEDFQIVRDSRVGVRDDRAGARRARGRQRKGSQGGGQGSEPGKRAADAHGHEEHAGGVHAMDSLKVSLPFDHTSILKEYRAQVPLEFDFKREAQMLTLIGDAIHGKVPDVETRRRFPSSAPRGW